jgi:TolB protein
MLLILIPVLAAAALSAGIAAGAVSAVDDAAAAAPRALVFASTRDGDSEIYRRTADGSVTQLTRNRRDDLYPSVSPDGNRIAFSSGPAGKLDIYVMRADGTEVRRLTMRAGREQYPAWSPDGRRIAFAGERDGRESELFLIDADGTGVQRLTFTRRVVTDAQPNFSPDGRHIVFTSNRIAYSNFEIYRLTLESRRLKRLTFSGAGDDTMPEYSPDGRRIAFASDRSGTYQVWTMNSAGRDLHQITRHRRSDAIFPTFSPDGNQLAYMTSALDGRRERLYTTTADGSSPRRLTDGGQPDW